MRTLREAYAEGQSTVSVIAPAALVSFALFAPYNARCALVGSWLREPLPMARDEHGNFQVKCAVPDGEHRYRFEIESLSSFMKNERVQLVDPRARRVTRADGEWAMVRVERGSDVTAAYEWLHDEMPLPADGALVIYEAHVAELGAKDGAAGTFLTLIERLDYLQSLGVTALELMPIGAAATTPSWGYDVRHAFAPEPTYGTPSELKRLVDECHARSIRVIFDLVLGHLESASPLTRVDFDYWFRMPREGELSYGAKLDYDRQDESRGSRPAHDFALEIAEYWVREYHIDGYRLDATTQIDNHELVGRVRSRCKALVPFKHFVVIAEHIPEDPTIAGLDGPADGSWRWSFHRQLLTTITNQERDGFSSSVSALLAKLDAAGDGYGCPSCAVNYLQSHDENAFVHELETFGVVGDHASKCLEVAATLLFTAVGIPMIGQGQEMGLLRAKRIEVVPLDMGLLEGELGRRLFAHHAMLGALQREHPALQGATLRPLFCQEEQRTFCFARGDGDGSVVVVANLGADDRELSLPLAPGPWHEVVFGYEIEAEADGLKDIVPAMSAKVFVQRTQ